MQAGRRNGGLIAPTRGCARVSKRLPARRQHDAARAAGARKGPGI